MTKENKKVLPQGITEFEIKVLGTKVIKNDNGGYIEFSAIDYDKRRMVKQTFMLAPNTLRNTLNSLAIWCNALVRNNPQDEADRLAVPDFEAEAIIAESLGETFDRDEATAKFINSAIAELNSINGEERKIHQTTNQGVNRQGVSRAYRNYVPYEYGTTPEAKATVATGSVLGYLG